MANTPILDFTIIDMHDPRFLGVLDLSKIPAGFTVVSPSIEIEPPQFSKSINLHSFNVLTAFNSSSLNITCEDENGQVANLPDGLWNIKISVAPAFQYFAEKSFMRVDAILLAWEKALLKSDIKEKDLSVSKQDKIYLDDIKFFIDGSVAAANQCDYNRAVQLYDLAKSLLDKYNKSKQC